MYEFWYDYGKIKYGEKEILCYTTTDSFNVYIKTDEKKVCHSKLWIEQPTTKRKEKENYCCNERLTLWKSQEKI